MSTEERFWSRVQKTDGCWNYIPPRRPLGINYAQVYYKGKYISSNRLAWLLTYGFLPGNMFVCHHCDNPKCVRPDHLFLGTADDNNKDKAKKGRARSGNLPRKLSDEQVLEALRKHYEDRVTMASLSREYGIGIRKLTSWFGRMRKKHGIEKKSWTPYIETSEVIRMRGDGMTIQELANHFNVSRWKISRILEDAQTGPTPARSKP